LAGNLVRSVPAALAAGCHRVFTSHPRLSPYNWFDPDSLAHHKSGSFLLFFGQILKLQENYFEIAEFKF